MDCFSSVDWLFQLAHLSVWSLLVYLVLKPCARWDNVIDHRLCWAALLGMANCRVAQGLGCSLRGPDSKILVYTYTPYTVVEA